MSQGTVYKIASEEIIRKGLVLAAEALEAANADIEFRDGRYTVKGTDRSITMTEIVERHRGASRIRSIPSRMCAASRFPQRRPCRRDRDRPRDRRAGTVRYTAVDDIGTVVNHVLAEARFMAGDAERRPGVRRGLPL